MGLVTLKEILSGCAEKHCAVGAFDTLDDNFTEAIISAAEEVGSRVILMIPDFFSDGKDDKQLIFYFNRLLERCRCASVPVCLHLDHGSTFAHCVQAIHWGCTSVMFDGSQLPVDENIAITRRLTEIAHACGVSVEGEIGHVGSAEGGALQESRVDTSAYTEPDDAKYFVEQTGVDALAVAVGTVHGLYCGTPKIDTERLDQIRKRVAVPLVLHGGSGLPETEFQAAIEHGICKVNFFTGISLAASVAIRNKLQEVGDMPIHYIELLQASHEACKAAVKEQIRIFGTAALNDNV